MMNRHFVFEEIGTVYNDVEEMRAPEDIRSRQSRIVIRPEMAAGLLGLEEVGHILVLFVFDRANEVRMRLHPRDDLSQPLRGVFATRTQYRPNPIGATVARLLRVEGTELIVEGLDAMNGSPVLDIKPFVPAFDSVNADQTLPSTPPASTSEEPA